MHLTIFGRSGSKRSSDVQLLQIRTQSSRILIIFIVFPSRVRDIDCNRFHSRYRRKPCSMPKTFRSIFPERLISSCLVTAKRAKRRKLRNYKQAEYERNRLFERGIKAYDYDFKPKKCWKLALKGEPSFLKAPNRTASIPLPAC